ncbi:MAG: M6 family metalloprotease domain-containing protein [Bacteroidales bacterium]
MKISTTLLKNVMSAALLLFFYTTQAAYLKNIPYQIIQPDGQSVSCYISGDEYYTYLHDLNNYTIIKNQDNGYYVYAVLSGDELLPSQYIVGKTKIAQTEIQPGINISPDKWRQLREDYWKDAPDKKKLPGYSASTTESSGTINNIVVYIRFSDQAEFTQSAAYYNGMFNNSTAGASSMKNYFLEASYGSMNIPSSFYPLPNGSLVVSYQDSYPRSYYMPYDASTNPNGYQSNQRTSREHILLKNATNAISSQIPAGLNIDYNNDNYVDNVCYIIRGGTTAWSTLLWPHRWSLYSETVYLQGNKRVYDYNFQLETFLDSYSVGVLAHEMFHTLGAPDLYHYTSNGIDPVGTWDLMCSNTNPPQHMSAYMKYKYGGWISSIPTITSSGTYTLNPLTSSTNNCFRINSPASSTEFFIVEFRKKTGTFEGQLPGSGLIIYRINSQYNGNAGGPPDEVYTYRLNGTPTANGSIQYAYFSSESGRTNFNNTTNPYCFLSNGNAGNIFISQVGSSAGSMISFTLGVGITANFSANPTNACPESVVSFSDLSTGSPTSWLWNFGDGNTSTLQNPTHQYMNPGTYTVTLIASNTNSTHTVVKTNYISVASNPVSVNITANPSTSVCSGMPVSFTAVGVNGGSSPVYQWFVNSVNMGGNSPTFTYTPANGDQVYCILISNISCPSGSPATSNSITMNVITGSLLPQPVFAAGSAIVCRNQVGIVYSISPLTGATSYNWSVSNGATITSGQGTNSITVSFSSTATSGSVVVYGINSCGNGPSAVYNYTVATTKPSTPGSISGLVNVPPGTTQTYSINPVANAITYNWTKPANTTIVSGQGTTSITLSFASNWNGGTLKVSASNCAGTSNSRSLKLKRSSKDNEIPGDVISWQQADVESGKVSPDNENSIVAYPNPASGNLSICYASRQNGVAIIKLFNLTGQLVLTNNFIQSLGINNKELNITDLPEGAYFISLELPDGTRNSTRLIISR